MSGTKDKSGGARVGAGRKKKPPQLLEIDSKTSGSLSDPKSFLLHVINDNTIDAKLRVDAAKALMPFIYTKAFESGKKDAAIKAAKVASTGKFAPSAPPKLKVGD